MTNDFSRIITLLRKEKGVTQKLAAQQFGISQALLSHYEKGIRECGLDFVVRAADYYGVSCDYLLGRSAERTGRALSVDDIPDPSDAKDSNYRGSVLPTLNKKLISNSLNILFDRLNDCPDKVLVAEISTYLSISVYKMFRYLYGSNSKNTEALFSMSRYGFDGYSNAALHICEGNIRAVLKGEDIGLGASVKDTSAFKMSTEQLMKDYSLFAPSLFNLIKNAEARMDKYYSGSAASE